MQIVATGSHGGMNHGGEESSTNPIVTICALLRKDLREIAQNPANDHGWLL